MCRIHQRLGVIIKRENNKVILIPEDYEDLVDLYLTLEKGDVICTRTSVVLKGNETREKEKIKVYLCIQVEEMKIDPHAKSLRIRGKILQGPKELPLTTMSINIRIGDKLETEWKDSFREFRENLQKIYVLCIDDRVATLAEIYRGKYRILYTVYRNDRELEDFIGEVIGLLRERNPENLVICGPMFYKEIVKSKLGKGVLIETSYGGEEGIMELLKRKEFLDKIGAIKEKEKLEKLQDALLDLVKEQASVGEEAIRNLMDGNVEEIFISRDYLKRLKENKDEEKLNLLLKLPKKYGANLYIIEGEHELAKQLYFLGGILVKKRW